ncbi:MAG: helix-turn-helix transcriptional regulator [Armatimonadetes bacterium]|nr:helix-turn-helix transcriptional regulator [Armatimonadota bacterium]
MAQSTAQTAARTPAGCCPECGCASHADSLDRKALAARAQVLAALADDTRLGIISLLAGHRALCVCDLVESFPVGQPTISHHLRVLREAGLVDAERRGVWSYYSLRRQACKELVGWLLDLV